MTTFVAILVLVALAFLVDAVNRARRRRLQEEGKHPPAGMGTDADVGRLVILGEKSSAVRLYRDIHGCGLKAAKQAVDRLQVELHREIDVQS